MTSITDGPNAARQIAGAVWQTRADGFGAENGKARQLLHSRLALLAAQLHRPREESQTKRPKGSAMKVRVIVTLKNGVLDPQGRAIHHALEGLGFGGVNDVRAGRVIELDVADATSDEALDDMCRKLLANMVIENYRIEKAA